MGGKVGVASGKGPYPPAPPRVQTMRDRQPSTWSPGPEQNQPGKGVSMT